VYDDDGSFTPTVTATDAFGASATASTVIVVQRLVVGINTSKTSTPNQVNFTAVVSPSGVSIASYAWNFGDGTTQTTTSNQTTHTYAVAGTYNVRVTARTTTGTSSTGTTTVSVP
jgi:PKD repeat protein